MFHFDNSFLILISVIVVTGLLAILGIIWFFQIRKNAIQIEIVEIKPGERIIVGDSIKMIQDSTAKLRETLEQIKKRSQEIDTLSQILKNKSAEAAETYNSATVQFKQPEY